MFYNPIGLLTLTKRETKRFLKVYMQTVFAPLLTNMLFLGVFGAALQNRDIGMEGINYLSFLIPGLCTLGAINSAFQNPSSSLIIQRYQNLIQDLNSYPISTFEKLLAYIASGTLRGVLVGILTYIASIPFVDVKIASPLLFLISLALISAIFAAIGLIVGLTIKTFDGVQFIALFIMTPLIYFGGVFFPVSQLPAFLSRIMIMNPMVPLIDIVRYTFLDFFLSSAVYNLAFLGILLAVSVSTGFILLKKGKGLTE